MKKEVDSGVLKRRHLMIYTFLLILVLLFFASRQQRIAQEAEQKTEELKKAEQEREKEIAGAGGLTLDSEDLRSLILVNESHPIPEGYQTVTEEIQGEEAVDQRIAGELLQMLEAAGQQGMELIVCSGYRTAEVQKELFEKEQRQYLDQGYTVEEAYTEAKKSVAVPGCGEHQIGLAVDIYAAGHESLDEAFGDTQEGLWLRQHAPEYGFILRYDRGKEAYTGINYEPWHFRYVGKTAAVYMAEHNLCLEEFYVEQSLYE